MGNEAHLVESGPIFLEEGRCAARISFCNNECNRGGWRGWVLERRYILFDLIRGDRVVVSDGQHPDVMAEVGRNMMLEGGSVATGLYEREVVVFTVGECKAHACPAGRKGHRKYEWG